MKEAVVVGRLDAPQVKDRPIPPIQTLGQIAFAHYGRFFRPDTLPPAISPLRNENQEEKRKITVTGSGWRISFTVPKRATVTRRDDGAVVVTVPDKDNPEKGQRYVVTEDSPYVPGFDI